MDRVGVDIWKATDELTGERDSLSIAKLCVDTVVPLTIEERAETAKRLDVDPVSLERVIPWTLSTEQRDRDRDRIKQSGWQLENFRKNPVILFAHDSRIPPIGRSLDTWIDESGKKGPRLRALIQFMPSDVNPFAHQIFRMAETGYLKASSVGFRPMLSREDPEATEKERVGSMYPPMLFEKTELLEASIVSIPSNPGALQEAKSVHGIDLGPLVEYAERILDEASGPGLWVPRKAWSDLWAELNTRKTFQATPAIEPESIKPTINFGEMKTALRLMFNREGK